MRGGRGEAGARARRASPVQPVELGDAAGRLAWIGPDVVAGGEDRVVVQRGVLDALRGHGPGELLPRHDGVERPRREPRSQEDAADRIERRPPVASQRAPGRSERSTEDPPVRRRHRPAAHVRPVHPETGG